MSADFMDVVAAVDKLIGTSMFVDVRIEGKRVTLNLDSATLDDLLFALCKQVGLTYDITWTDYGPAPPIIELRRGDVSVDPRPVTVLDDYILRVTHVEVRQHRELDFRWGAPKPTEPQPTDGTYVTLLVTPRSFAAAKRLRGLRRTARALPDVGQPLFARPGPYGDLVFFNPTDLAARRNQDQSRDLWLPLPDPRATVLTRLVGALDIARTHTTQLRIPPGSEGNTLIFDDATVLVRTWHQDGHTLHVGLDITYPPPAAHNGVITVSGWDWQTSTLLAAGGLRLRPTSTKTGGFYFRYTLDLDFPLSAPASPGAAPTPITPEAVLVTLNRFNSTYATIPFVLKNVPLP
jgi:hypothetical protein